MQKHPSKLYLGERSVAKPYELNGFLQGAVSNYSKSVARAAFADGTVLFDRSAYPPIGRTLRWKTSKRLRKAFGNSQWHRTKRARNKMRHILLRAL